MKNDQIKLQHQTIEQVVSILNKYDSVVAAALMGSYVDNTETAFSDIDMIVVFKDDEREHLRKIFDEVASLKPTLSTLYQLSDKESLILYEDGVRLDLTLEKRSDFNKWILEPVKVLFDKKGVLDQMMKDSQGKYKIPSKAQWNDKDGHFVDWFFWMFRQAYCYACQSDLIRRKSFEKKGLTLDSIQKIRDKLLNTLYYLNGKRNYLANINKNLLSKFSQTYPSSSVDEMKSSIRVLVELYENIIGEYCLKEKIEYPKEKVKRIRSLFAEFDSYCKFSNSPPTPHGKFEIGKN